MLRRPVSGRLGASPEHRAEASWILHPADFGNLAGLGSTDGELVFPSLHDAEPEMFGSRLYVDPNRSTPAASAKNLLFGSMRLAFGIRRGRREAFACCGSDHRPELRETGWNTSPPSTSCRTLPPARF
jgi:hypothetical protein